MAALYVLHAITSTILRRVDTISTDPPTFRENFGWGWRTGGGPFSLPGAGLKIPGRQVMRVTATEKKLRKDMRDLGTYRPQFDRMIRICAGMMDQYRSMMERLEAGEIRLVETTDSGPAERYPRISEGAGTDSGSAEENERGFPAAEGRWRFCWRNCSGIGRSW